MSAAWAEVLIGALSGLGGALVVLIRITVRWSRIEADFRHFSATADKVHAEIYTQLREDRAVTDRRLRWLEETLWKGRR